MPASELIPTEHVQSGIIVLRGQRVMLDADLAVLYGVPTKRLNEQVKRNSAKFPEDFCFQLTIEQAAALRSQFAISKSRDAVTKPNSRTWSQDATASEERRGGRRYPPYAFTEHGAIQAANVLNSEAATRMSVAVVRAFVQLRQLVVNHKAIAAKLAELDAHVGAHGEQLAAIVEAIRLFTTPDAPVHGRRIGFHG